ncbi:hypothetical protein I4U23_030737 [Adineta vaga]|nr:hypothetical protein I4U23_030737 [Adineta vaga]
MARNSLSEESLDRFEHYFSSNPYREYSMNKPYFPRASHSLTHSNRPIPTQESSTLAFHQLLNDSKNSLTLDRLAYKLRMKSDLNIDTLREMNGRQYRHQRNQQYSSPQNHINFEASDIISSVLPSTSTGTTKSFLRQPPTMTLSTEAMKTLANEDLNGVEGNAVRVGAVDDLIKRFRPAEHQVVRHPIDYPLSPSTCVSINISRHDRVAAPKSQQQERQPQALTEYRFKTPTLPTLLPRTRKISTNHQGLFSQPRTREQHTNTDNPDVSILQQYPLNSPEQHRHRLNFFGNQSQHTPEINSHERRIQDTREKSLMRTEKQLCVCNKLTIIDPFNSSTDRMDTAIYQFQHQQTPITTNYIFPPVRPFGYFTKKSTIDETQLSTNNASLSPRHRKKHGITKNPRYISGYKSDTFEKNGNYRTFTGRIKSVDSLSNDDDDNDDNNERHNTAVATDANGTTTLVQTINNDEL